MFPISVGLLNSITYIIPLNSARECLLIDCGDLTKVLEDGWTVKSVLLTHAHFDHTYGLNKLLSYFPDVKIYTNLYGLSALQDARRNFSHYHDEYEDFIFLYPENVHLIESAECLYFSNSIQVDVVFTPGHDPSCISYMIDDCLFTGDSYIPGVKVVASFPRSDKQQAALSLQLLKEMELKGYRVYPGHQIVKR